MSKFFAIIALTCLLSLAALPQEQTTTGKSPVERAQEVLQQARVALGGEANLKAVQSLSASGEYKNVTGQRPTSGQIKFDLLLPDKYLKTVSVSPNQMMQITLLEAVNGDEAWTDRKMSSAPMTGGEGFGGAGGGLGGGGGMGGGGAGGGMGGGGAGGMGGGMGGGGGRGGGRGGGGGMGGGAPQPGGGMGRMSELDPQMQAYVQERTRAEYARLATTWLLAAPASLPLEFSYDRELETKEGKADAVRVTGAKDFTMWIVFDQTTHRPAIVIYREVRPRRPSNDAEEAAREPQAIDVQLYLRDYKQVNNIWLPHQIVKASNNQFIEEWKLKYKLNPNLKPKMFEKPQKKS